MINQKLTPEDLERIKELEREVRDNLPSNEITPEEFLSKRSLPDANTTDTAGVDVDTAPGTTSSTLPPEHPPEPELRGIATKFPDVMEIYTTPEGGTELKFIINRRNSRALLPEQIVCLEALIQAGHKCVVRVGQYEYSLAEFEVLNNPVSPLTQQPLSQSTLYNKKAELKRYLEMLKCSKKGSLQYLTLQRKCAFIYSQLEANLPKAGITEILQTQKSANGLASLTKGLSPEPSPAPFFTDNELSTMDFSTLRTQFLSRGGEIPSAQWVELIDRRTVIKSSVPSLLSEQKGTDNTTAK